MRNLASGSWVFNLDRKPSKEREGWRWEVNICGTSIGLSRLLEPRSRRGQAGQPILAYNITTHSGEKSPQFGFISLACVSSETNNLQRVFRPGGGRGSPLYRLYSYVPRQKVFFKLFWFEIGYQFRPFWSETGYGLCLLVLNWVCFLKELATSSSFGDETISLLIYAAGSMVSGLK